MKGSPLWSGNRAEASQETGASPAVYTGLGGMGRWNPSRGRVLKCAPHGLSHGVTWKSRLIQGHMAEGTSPCLV